MYSDTHEFDTYEGDAGKYRGILRLKDRKSLTEGEMDVTIL